MSETLVCRSCNEPGSPDQYLKVTHLVTGDFYYVCRPSRSATKLCFRHEVKGAWIERIEAAR